MKDALIRIVEAFHKYNSEHMAAKNLFSVIKIL